MKILFVGANYEHTNDMHINNLLALKDYAEVDFWGPGYVDINELELGVEHKLKNENYDALLLDFTFAMFKSDDRSFAFDFWINRYYMANCSVFEVERYVDDCIDQCMKYSGVKLLFYRLDSTSFIESWRKKAQLLIDSGFYFIGQGIELVPYFEWNEELTSIIKRYRNFIVKNRAITISYTHSTVVYREFLKKPLLNREYDITVPGNLDLNIYTPRAMIYKKIASTNMKFNDNYQQRNIAYREQISRCDNSVYLRTEDKMIDEQLELPCVYLNARVSRENIALWKLFFDEVLKSTKIAYVDGGVGKQIVRKFCEIPARGMLMLCPDIPPLEAYGLKDGENMIVVNENNIIDTCEYMLKNPEAMQKIADNGQRMVFKKHTASKHAKTVIDSIERIKDGTFNGSHWENGIFMLD